MEHDYKMVRGNTLPIAFEIKNTDANLTHAYFSVKQNEDDTTYLFQKAINSGILLINDTTYLVKIAPSDTANLDLGTYYYDLKLHFGNDKYTVLRGRLVVTNEITTE